jgi:hypothetical protein
MLLERHGRDTRFVLYRVDVCLCSGINIMHRLCHAAVQIRREVRLAADSALNAGPEEKANWLTAPTLLTLADQVYECACSLPLMAPLRHADGL